jgi:hypothetical protein
MVGRHHVITTDFATREDASVRAFVFANPIKPKPRRTLATQSLRQLMASAECLIKSLQLHLANTVSAV